MVAHSLAVRVFLTLRSWRQRGRNGLESRDRRVEVLPQRRPGRREAAVVADAFGSWRTTRSTVVVDALGPCAICTAPPRGSISTHPLPQHLHELRLSLHPRAILEAPMRT